MAVFIKQVNIPQKSDLINIDMTGSGTAQTYRIIKKISDDVVEVIAMNNASNQKFAESGQTYENNTLDTYLNTTWYNTLSSTAKIAIVDKTFRQDKWYWGTIGNPIYPGRYNSGRYSLSLDNASFGNEITRHCYVISVQDIIDYLEVTSEMTQENTTLTNDNIWTMFWNSTTSHSGYLWLRSAYASSNIYTFIASGGDGSVSESTASLTRVVRPAFQIDLSKIDYTFTDGRQPVELKPVSILQKSNNALSRVGMSWKQASVQYNGIINYGGHTYTLAYIKVNGTASASNYDYIIGNTTPITESVSLSVNEGDYISVFESEYPPIVCWSNVNCTYTIDGALATITPNGDNFSITIGNSD